MATMTAPLQEAAETAASLAQAIQDHTTDENRKVFGTDACLAEINDFAEALGNYITGTEDFRQGEWLEKWRGIRPA